MITNAYGKAVADEWLRSGEMRKDIELYEFVVMPNHFHGVVFINRYDESDDEQVVGERDSPLLTDLGMLIAGFKSAVTSNLRKLGWQDRVWQRNYFEHIIRNEDDMRNIREYVIANPRSWSKDTLYYDDEVPSSKSS